MPQSIKKEVVWVYKMAHGKYYKQHNKGSWAVSLNGVRTKDISSNLANATRFSKKLDTVPYCHPSMIGGQWLQVEITTTIEILVSDQKD